MFELIDNWLLDVIFQPFQNKFQRITGKNCFFLARQFFIVSMVTYLFFAWFCSVDIFIGSILSLSVVVIVLDFIGCWIIITIHEKEYINNKMTCNNLRTSTIKRRLMCINSLSVLFIFFIPITIVFFTSQLITNIVVFASLYFLFNFIGSYFVACTPLPPGSNWFKETKRKLGDLLKPKPKLEPIPIRIK